MNRWQAQYSFWSQFAPAYDEASVPDEAAFPYITYQGAAGGFDSDFLTTASIWTRGFEWAEANELADTIETALRDGGATVPYDGGLLWITANAPFAQNMGDPNDDLIKRKLLQVTLHFS